MTAFLFDEDHPDLEMIFGPQCAAPIINAIEDSGDMPPLRILRGSLLHSRYCYDLAEVTLRTQEKVTDGISASTSGQTLKPDMDHFLTIICDLAETMHSSGSSMTEDELQIALAKKNIWVVVLQALPESCLPAIEKPLSEFGPYLGWIKVDWDNPVHMDLFGGSLFNDMFIDKDGLCKLSDWPLGSEDRDEEEALLSEYGSRSTPRLLDYLTFQKAAPKLLEAGEPSDRAQLAVKRILGELPNHRKKIGKALSQDNFEAVGDFRTFSTSRPEDGIHFFVPEEKLTKYLLKLDHPVGGPKARFFIETLEILPEDWRYLADQFCQAAQNSDFYRLDVKQYGVMHGAVVLVTGRNGRVATVETGWKLEQDGPAILVTAYPTDKGKTSELLPVKSRVPSLSTPDPERWAEIHKLAHENGVQRGNAKNPTPMVLEKWGTIWEGQCGFGWVLLPNARAPFARWALKSNIGFASRPGVQISSKLPTQSIEKNLAYAEGYAEVLKVNGIECCTESRLD
ncbi:hypothetical protein KBW81_14940 [Loktanella salsilacus]|uniref:DUF6883 domain-containing protein n=1 Tax=Loktanella salsilacus TaxID=195913 RepID=UPI0020B67229|nr:DUF6883 domain-containing protein [Loktanella salsilacus]UTH47968.1 hypothetical protein KBW81_14940 [Loktanella salsilacus]